MGCFEASCTMVPDIRVIRIKIYRKIFRVNTNILTLPHECLRFANITQMLILYILTWICWNVLRNNNHILGKFILSYWKNDIWITAFVTDYETQCIIEMRMGHITPATLLVDWTVKQLLHIHCSYVNISIRISSDVRKYTPSGFRSSCRT